MKVKVHPLGNSILLLIWENKISDEIHRHVLQVQALLNKFYQNEILEIVPSYQSLSVYFHHKVSVLSYLKEIENTVNKTIPPKVEISSTTYYIPVCYEPKYAPDLNRVLDFHSMSHEELIELHTTPLYKVFFIGFLPGFPYLGGLNEKLHTPRKENPSRKVKKGSVAIGGEQTGIYTTNSPGGWNVIGESPVNFFDINDEKPALFKAGDFIKFFSIDEKTYQVIKAKVAKNDYTIKSERVHD